MSGVSNLLLTQAVLNPSVADAKFVKSSNVSNC